MTWPSPHSLDPSAVGERYRHRCEDGHWWDEQPDGGVSPSWGFGLTSVKYEGWDPKRCPEPERGHSRYPNGGPYHGYKCPTCGEVHYVGGCLQGVRCDPWNATDCEPPPPACGKPAVSTARYVRGLGYVYGPAYGEQMTIDQEAAARAA